MDAVERRNGMKEASIVITLDEAQRIISATQEKAQEIGQPTNVAVVDAGRNLKAFARMEDA
jgi:uncharacterized protein GlcG (DUF336 family)